VPRFDIVPERSHVWIDARSTLHPIHSQTAGLEGYIEAAFRDGRLDLSTSTVARLSLPVDRLQSGNAMQDRELKRRISARRYPTIDGELTGIADGHDDGTYLVNGTVTFRGESRAYERPMTIRMNDERTVELEGDAVFDVRDFGMEPPKILMFRVEPEVAVRVEIIATER
jgi:polyisoprenoid-binding protein YceI